jgi:hypothetical protein
MRSKRLSGHFLKIEGIEDDLLHPLPSFCVFVGLWSAGSSRMADTALIVALTRS